MKNHGLYSNSFRSNFVLTRRSNTSCKSKSHFTIILILNNYIAKRFIHAKFQNNQPLCFNCRRLLSEDIPSLKFRFLVIILSDNVLSTLSLCSKNWKFFYKNFVLASKSNSSQSSSGWLWSSKSSTLVQWNLLKNKNWFLRRRKLMDIPKSNRIK